jgi:hypothetical protein
MEHTQLFDASSETCSRRRSARSRARSIRYQLTIAKLPLAKDLDDFQFAGTPINETLVRDLAGGASNFRQRDQSPLMPRHSKHS